MVAFGTGGVRPDGKGFKGEGLKVDDQEFAGQQGAEAGEVFDGFHGGE